jgi:hypothetical protein
LARFAAKDATWAAQSRFEHRKIGPPVGGGARRAEHERFGRRRKSDE